ncbi:MAG: hypothetical protein Q9N62_11740 [Ghiorsea sp.]|nr:hypothetical protein [Ghiorsea sp.]
MKINLLIFTLLISTSVVAERYPPLENGMVTKNSIIQMYDGFTAYLQNDVKLITDEKERVRAENSVRDWHLYLSSYVQLVDITSINDVNSLFLTRAQLVFQSGEYLVLLLRS